MTLTTEGSQDSECSSNNIVYGLLQELMHKSTQTYRMSILCSKKQKELIDKTKWQNSLSLEIVTKSGFVHVDLCNSIVEWY